MARHRPSFFPSRVITPRIRARFEPGAAHFIHSRLLRISNRRSTLTGYVPDDPPAGPRILAAQPAVLRHPGVSMALFTCSECQHETRTSDSQVGRVATCPECGGRGAITPDAPPRAMPPEVKPAPGAPIVIERGAPRVPPSSASPPALPVWASVIIGLSFGLLGVSTSGGVLLFVVSLSSATGAPQEAAAGAIFSALFIAGYTITRSIEKVVRAIARR